VHIQVVSEETEDVEKSEDEVQAPIQRLVAKGWMRPDSDGDPPAPSRRRLPPREEPLGIGEPIVDVEAFVEGRLIGGFRKLDRPPIPIHKPHERGYAESEISIDPYPPQQGQPTRVSAVV